MPPRLFLGPWFEVVHGWEGAIDGVLGEHPLAELAVVHLGPDIAVCASAKTLHQMGIHLIHAPTVVARRCVEVGATVKQRAVDHVHELIEATAIGASEGELTAMAAAKALAQGTCVAEGISGAVLQCILDAPTYRDFWALGDCQAVRAEQPSWLSTDAPPGPVPGWADMTPDELRQSLR